MPMLTSFCRHEAQRWRTSAFAVPMRRSRRPQLAPLAARIKELEEELTRAVSDRDAFRSWAEEVMASGKALAGQLGAE